MSSVIENYVSVVKNCMDFNGRATRSQYWQFVAMNLAIGIGLQVMDFAIGFPILGLMFMLAMFLPGLSVSVRRLHDSDRSGWWLLVGLVPILGGLAVIALMLMPGTTGSNRFGQAFSPAEQVNRSSIPVGS